MSTENAAAAPGDDAGIEHDVNIGDTVRASWSISTDDLRKNISNSSPEAQDLLVWCFLWSIDDAHPYRIEEFASTIGSDKTTIQRIIKGVYKHPATGERLAISTKLTKAMELFKKMELERAQGSRIAVVKTETFKRIHQACHLARESQSPVFLIGPSHIGKTVALKEYKEDNNHGRTCYVRLQAASGLGGMIRAIAKGVGIGGDGNTAEMIARIKRALKPNMLLILDEVHQLLYTYRIQAAFACLEVIREIYDACGCGLVLCGTDILMKKVQGSDELEQLLRRGVHKVTLPEQPTRKDVAAILEAVGLELPDRAFSVKVRVGGEDFVDRPYEILRQIGKAEGLKAITERLRYGQKLAAKAKDKLAWEHVVGAHLTIRQNNIASNDWN